MHTFAPVSPLDVLLSQPLSPAALLYSAVNRLLPERYRNGRVELFQDEVKALLGTHLWDMAIHPAILRELLATYEAAGWHVTHRPAPYPATESWVLTPRMPLAG